MDALSQHPIGPFKRGAYAHPLGLPRRLQALRSGGSSQPPPRGMTGRRGERYRAIPGWRGDDLRWSPYLVGMNAPVPSPSILDSVGVDPARAREILGDALIGADDGELFVERSESESFLFDDGRLKSAAYDATEGFGLRVVAGRQPVTPMPARFPRRRSAAPLILPHWRSVATMALPPKRPGPPTPNSMARKTRSHPPSFRTRSPCCRKSMPGPAPAIPASFR